MSTLYTYWILPETSVQAMLQEKVDELAMTYGTPRFEPHMTLLGGFTPDLELALAKVDEVAVKLRGLSLTFGVVEFTTTYFQNVFVRINASVDLMDGYVYGRDVFGIHKDTVFMPHVSLLYGDLSIRQRAEAARSIVIPTQTFQARSLVVTPFAPNPADWEHLKEIRLQ